MRVEIKDKQKRGRKVWYNQSRSIYWSSIYIIVRVTKAMYESKSKMFVYTVSDIKLL